MTYRRLFPVPARRVALALAAGTALGLSACDRDDDTARAIDQASVSLQALAPGGANPPSAEYRSKVYGEVASNLQKVSSSATKSQTAAAALLLSQAQAGLADAPASEAAEAERLSQAQIGEIRGLLGEWLRLNALADAAGAYNPAKELADIDAQTTAREEERVEQQKRKAAVDQQVASIRTQAKIKADAANAKQQEAGSLRSQVPNQTAVQGEQTLKRAAEISRQADALEVEAEVLEAQAAQIAPQSAEIQLEIDRLSNQKDLLAQARAAVQKRTDAQKTTAASARAEAAKVGEQIKAKEGDLSKHRSDTLTPAFDKAITNYTAAAGSAKRAQSEIRTSGQMAYGSAEQSLGDVQWAKAQGLAGYADMLEALAGATSPLPGADGYKTEAATARAAAKEALEAATAAYSSANDAYQAGGGSADKERLDRLNASLAKAVSVTSGGSKDIRNPDAPKEETPAAAPAPSEAPPTAEASTPQATVQALLDAQTSASTVNVADLFNTGSDQEKQALQSLFGTVAPKMKALGEALKAKFGTDVEQLAGQAGGAPGADFAKLKNLKASDLQFTVNGDSAEAQVPGGQTLRLTKKDGKWLIEPSSVGLQSQTLPMLQAMIPALSSAADETAAEINAGKYPDAKAAMAAFQQKMMAAAMGKK